MINRTVSPKPIATPQRPGQSAHEQARPGPSPASEHPTGPAPPFDPDEEEVRQSDDARGTNAKRTHAS